MSNWINIKQDLPKIEGTYWVAVKSHINDKFIEYATANFSFLSDNHYGSKFFITNPRDENKIVTHWMPIIELSEDKIEQD